MIQDILPRYQEVANGSKTVFTFPFDVLRNEFIEVYVDSDKVISGWTLSASEKTITFGVAPVAGKLVTIYRNIPIAWLNSVGTASSVSIDEAVTYLVAQIQTIKEGLSRAIQTRIVDTDKGEDLSDDYINSLGQATALYGECETLLAQIQVEGAAINALYEEFVERITNLISTDPNLTNPSDEVVPSQKAIKTYVDNKDSQAVHKTGNETITGVKTFQNAWPVLKTTAVAYTETPSSNVYSGLIWSDKNDDTISNFYTALYSGGSGATHLYLRNKAGAESRISLCYSSNGTFYTEAPTPTVTTETNSTQIANAGWVNSVGNNVMHLTGTETITGVKTFTNATRNRILSTENRTGTFMAQNMKYTLGTTPTSDISTQMQMRDSADDWAALWEHSYRSDGGTLTSLSCRRANKSASSSLAIGYKANGTVYTYAPASDENNSIVTTVNKSKSSNGYFQLGNGLIIQWGRTLVRGITNKTIATITLPKAFTTTNYTFTGTYENNTSTEPAYTDDVTFVTTSITTTQVKGFGYDAGTNVYDAYIRWVAIGY